MERVIYLDIDGVLNTHFDLMNMFEGKGEHLFYSRGDFVELGKLRRLQRLVSEAGASVVVVSSWVSLNDTGEKICEFLELPYHSEALNTGGGIHRGRKVKEHIKMHGLSEENIVIIDDAGDRMYEDLTRCVVINGREGLTDKDCQDALGMFENEPRQNNNTAALG